LVSYICVDAIVPNTEQFHFLASPPKKDKDGNVISLPSTVVELSIRNRTIRAKKIRGIYSEGLIMPAPPGFQEGDSIIEYFNLTKRVYEEELPEQTSSSHESPPTTFSLFKYDLEGVAKYKYVFQDDEPVIITEKIEGENCAIMYAEDRLWVRSRNYFKKNEPDSHWWDLPRRLNLEEKLKQFPNLAIWFELYGAVKGWSYDCPIVNGRIERKGRVFDIWDIKQRKFLEWKDVQNITQQIGMETVPVLYEGPWKSDHSLNILAEGQSTIGKCVKEGWVMRSTPEGWHEKLGRKIIKLKGRDYKIAKG